MRIRLKGNLLWLKDHKSLGEGKLYVYQATSSPAWPTATPSLAQPRSFKFHAKVN